MGRVKERRRGRPSVRYVHGSRNVSHPACIAHIIHNGINTIDSNWRFRTVT
jgi:hypothetical protein